MKKTAVYPGSFDPITKGHIDIIKRSAKLFDELKIGILINSSKKNWFTIEERIELVKRILKEENIEAEVLSFMGLTVDFMAEQNADILVRGLRAVSDYEYELAMAYANYEISNEEVETVFLPARKEFMYLSSSVVRDIAINGGNLKFYLENYVEKKVIDKVSRIEQ